MQYNQHDRYDVGVETLPAQSVLATNKLIRNTYLLLSATLAFSAIMAGLAMAMNMPALNPLLTLVAFLGLFFVTAKLRNSAWGLAAVFALTGFMGLTLGPVISLYLTRFSNGHELVMMAFGTTAVMFLGLSGYALTSRKNFNFLGSFLFIGLMVALVGLLVAWLFAIPALSLALSAVVVMLMAGYILYDTSRMVHGEETNYIMATISLYVNIYNLFINLLALLGFGFGED
jgi:modulator of FtsH protease